MPKPRFPIRVAAQDILKRPDVLSLDLVGLDRAGPWVLLARTLLPEVSTMSADLHLSSETDQTFVDQLFIPLLRRVGDFRTAAVMLVPSPLTLRNLADASLRHWFRDVYRAAGAGELLRFESSNQPIIRPGQNP